MMKEEKATNLRTRAACTPKRKAFKKADEELNLQLRTNVHADNCTGQNKNDACIQYLLWRVM